ncbi:MAG: energy-coupling factor transporter transmembrane component T family protein [Chloroflexota bacterium]
MIGTARFLSYHPGVTYLHRIDPRTKLLGALAVAAAALMASVPYGMIVAYALGLTAGLTAPRLLPRLIRLIRPLLLFIVLFGLLIVVTTPGHALVHIWIIVPTRDGVDLAVRLGLQVLLIAFTSSLLTLTTAPLALAGALSWALSPLARIRFPVREVVSMVTIGLTFVPLLLEEAQKVIAAQRARGADLSLNALLLDEDSIGALLIPLLLANLRRGGELADSMESRLYDTGPRTSLHEYTFGRPDSFAFSVMILGLAVDGVVSFLPL